MRSYRYSKHNPCLTLVQTNLHPISLRAEALITTSPSTCKLYLGSDMMYAMRSFVVVCLLLFYAIATVFQLYPG